MQVGCVDLYICSNKENILTGVAVSVTTFTDVIAFFVGSNTVLPGLESFCIYAAMAIFSIYALQVTHFVAWFSLGQYIISNKHLIVCDKCGNNTKSCFLCIMVIKTN